MKSLTTGHQASLGAARGDRLYQTPLSPDFYASPLWRDDRHRERTSTEGRLRQRYRTAGSEIVTEAALMSTGNRTKMFSPATAPEPRAILTRRTRERRVSMNLSPDQFT